MNRLVAQHPDHDAMSRQCSYRGTMRIDSSDSTGSDASMPAEISASEPANRRIWRAISGILLANVVLFWILTCIMAFAHTAGT